MFRHYPQATATCLGCHAYGWKGKSCVWCQKQVCSYCSCWSHYRDLCCQECWDAAEANLKELRRWENYRPRSEATL